MLLGDVLVPRGRTLTLLPHTRIILNDVDLNNLGELKNKPELIIEGSLRQPLKGEGEVKFLNAQAEVVLPDFSRQTKLSNMVEIVPQEVDLSPLGSDWRNYKRLYPFLWTVIGFGPKLVFR